MAQTATADLCKVSNALSSEQTQANAAGMLLAGLPSAIQGGVSRHPFQAELLSLTADFLKESRQRALEESSSKQAAAEDAHKVLSELQAAVETALLTRGAAAEELSKVSTALDDAISYVKATKDEYNTAKIAHCSVAERLTGLRQERARTATITDGTLPMLLEGHWKTEGEMDEAVQGVQILLREIKAEDVLVSASANALAQRPGTRSPFCEIIANGIVETLSENLRQLDANIVKGEQEARQKKAEELGFWALADVAKDRLAVARRAKSKAEAALKSAIAECEHASERVARQETSLSNCVSEQTIAEQRTAMIGESLEALDRLVTDSYIEEQVDVQQTGAEPSESMAGPDVEMAALPPSAGKDEATEEAGELQKAGRTTRNPFNAPTPMAVAVAEP